MEAAEVLSRLPLPSASEDQEALLSWAYFEATSILRQYGDLLEELRDYMNTGSSSVGECVFLMEEEMSI